MLPALFRFLARLPLPLLHNLGALAGWLAWLASPTYRRNFRLHIGQAGMMEAKAEAIAEAGKALLELPKIWLRPQDEVIERVVRVSGWELVEAAWAAKRGIVFLTPHLGCFEITAQYYAARKPMTVLYRRPKPGPAGAVDRRGARGEPQAGAGGSLRGAPPAQGAQGR